MLLNGLIMEQKEVISAENKLNVLKAWHNNDVLLINHLKMLNYLFKVIVWWNKLPPQRAFMHMA